MAGILIPERVSLRLAWAERSALFGGTGPATTASESPSTVTVMELTKELAAVALDPGGRSSPIVVTCPSGAESGRVPVLFTTSTSTEPTRSARTSTG